MEKKPLDCWKLWCMSVGLLGINFGWGLQMANMSAIYEYLGAKPDGIPILWLAAPLTGLLVQPIIGYFSDRTWIMGSRRKPYLIAGAILASVSLIYMPLSTSILMAALLLWVLDATVNVSMGPFRALVPDLLPEKQHTKGYIFQGITIALGTVIASAMPWILQHLFCVGSIACHAKHTGAHEIPMIVKLSFFIGAIVFFLTVLWTSFSIKEYPAPADQPKRAKRGIAAIWHDIVNMPKKMRKLAWVMFFSWMGLFCMFMFFPIAVATKVFGGHAGTAAYLEGIEWAGICCAIYPLVCLVCVTFVFPWLTKIIQRRTIHIISLLFGALGLIGILFVHSKFEVFWMMLGVGIAFASIQSMPYAMLANSIPQDKNGIYMGIFNLFIVIPEIIIALTFGFILKHFLHDSRVYAVVAGGVFMAIAALMTLRVKDSEN